MSYTTVYDEIIFIEGNHDSVSIIKEVKVDFSFTIGAQLKNLTDIKKEIAKEVKKAGGNCVVDFKYGQKSRWLAIDDVKFWGSGKAAVLPEEIYREIIGKKAP